MMFTPDGRLLSQMGGNLGMYSPRGLFIDPSGALYVADTGRGRVLKLASTGQLLGEFRGSGQLEQPVAVVAAGDGTMYVADAEKHQMLVLDAKDQVLRSWAMMPATTFDAPDVALGLRGELYVSDPRNGVVRVFDQEGRTLTELGSPGARNGQFNLPTGICVDGSGQLWVADTGNKGCRDGSFDKRNRYAGEEGMRVGLDPIHPCSSLGYLTITDHNHNKNPDTVNPSPVDRSPGWCWSWTVFFDQPAKQRLSNSLLRPRHYSIPADPYSPALCHITTAAHQLTASLESVSKGAKLG